MILRYRQTSVQPKRAARWLLKGRQRKAPTTTTTVLHCLLPRLFPHARTHLLALDASEILDAVADAALLERLEEHQLNLVQIVGRFAHETRPPPLHVPCVVKRNVTAQVQVTTVVALWE